MEFDWVTLLLWYGVFLFSTTMHEAAHAWAGLKLGDDTAHRGGQVTLDPTPHIRREPMGMVVVPLLSWIANGWMIGWASAPYDAEWGRAYPRRRAMIACAGPLSNLLLVLVSALCIRLGMAFGVFDIPEAAGWMRITAAIKPGVWPALAALLSLLFSMNLLLCSFNLLPLPPLDGASLALLLLPPRAAEGYSNFMSQPMMRLIGLLVAWKIFGAIFDPIWTASLNLLYPGTGFE